MRSVRTVTIVRIIVTCTDKSKRNTLTKSADKGSGTVVMDRDWYINESLRQLNNTKFYKLLDNDITTDIQKRIL